MQLKYKIYTAEVTFSALTFCFHGEVTNLKSSSNYRDTMVFLSSNKHALQEAFQQAVEQYLERSLSQHGECFVAKECVMAD